MKRFEGVLVAGRVGQRLLGQRARKPVFRLQNVHTTAPNGSAKRSSSIAPWAYGLAGLAAGVLATVAGYSAIGAPNGVSSSSSQDCLPAIVEPSAASPMAQYADRATMLLAAREIQQALGEDAVSLDADDLEAHGYSEWSTSNSETRPAAVVRPTSTEEVSTVARICTKHRVPMIPFGAGSSVEGNVSCPYSGFCVDLSRMDRILAVHADDMDAVVQPGVNWVALNERLKPEGLFLPLDPSPTALVGGMVATNCSGTNAMRYGTMKDWVLGLTVVLADGAVVKTRHRPRKTSAGYNLTALFAGSEGTLGIVTEIAVKLAIPPAHFAVATTTFPSVKHLAQAATDLMRRGIPLAALEMMDEVQMRVINQTGGTGSRPDKKTLWPERPTLFIKFAGPSVQAVRDDMAAARAVAEQGQYGGADFRASAVDDEAAMADLWAARKQALWAMLAVRPEGTQIWSTDVAVPLSRLAEIVDTSRANASQLGLFATVLGHVGDGNFHQTIMYDPRAAEQVAGVRRCVDAMVRDAVAKEGTVSGEHGIGLGKKHCLEQELGPATIGVMRTLKRSLDPHWLLNPGKVIDF